MTCIILYLIFVVFIAVYEYIYMCVCVCVCVVFRNCLNKAARRQIFPVDLIFFLDYWREIDNILVYLIRYSKIMLWTMEQKIFCVKTYYETQFFKIALAGLKKKFNFNTSINKSQIFKLIKKFEVHATCGDCRATSSSPYAPLKIQEECTRIINNFKL